MRHLLALAAVTLCATCSGSQHAQAPAITHATLAITNVRVFDGERVLSATDVLVDGDKIVAVGSHLAIPPNVTVVDGKDRTLLPGLIDSHAHVFEAGQLEQSLAFGVTTVLDMFSFPPLIKQFRTEDRSDRADIRSAGTLATAPGGHGTEYGFEIPTISSPAEAQAFVDARFAEGSDYLKIVLDNGSAYGVKIPTISAETLRALITAAHARHKLAVVHIGSYEDARAAIEAGADGLMHLFRDRAPGPDFGQLAASHHAFVAPTLAVLQNLLGEKSKVADDPALSPYLDPAGRKQLASSFPIRVKPTPRAAELAIEQLRDAKVPILCGTDAPNPGTAHGISVHDELALLVGAGLPPQTALAGATSLPAARFGLTDRGRIAVGQRADLLLVDGDPTTKITDTRRIVAVWRAGTKLDRDAIKTKLAAVAAAPPPAAHSLISNFDDGSLQPKFGQAWVASTDALIGGKSTGDIKVVDKALAITGEVIAGGPASWSGAMVMPGDRPFAPADLSKTTKLTFRAKGDGKAYVVMVFTQKGGRMPAVRPFTPGKAFTDHSFAWADFNSDGSDVTAILFAQVDPGAFSLVIDDVALN